MIEGIERLKRVQASQRIITDIKNTRMTCFIRKAIAGKGSDKLIPISPVVLGSEGLVAYSYWNQPLVENK